MCECVLNYSVVFATLWAVPHQAPLPIGVFRQEYWSGVIFPPPWDPPELGIRD